MAIPVLVELKKVGSIDSLHPQGAFTDSADFLLGRKNCRGATSRGDASDIPATTYAWTNIYCWEPPRDNVTHEQVLVPPL